MIWNPWHGCHKISEGCRNCYVYRMDAKYEKDSSSVKRNKCFYDLIKRKRDGSYKIEKGETIYTCFTSDFLIEEADEWRSEAWDMIRERRDLHFIFITKRIDRFIECIPEDWNEGYDNVTVGCTCENQEMADYRLPIFKASPIKHRIIICEPLLGQIDLRGYSDNGIEMVIAGGESGENARICSYDWVLNLRKQCLDSNTGFYFKQTGARIIKDGKLYNIKRSLQHSQAKKANIDIENKNLPFDF